MTPSRVLAGIRRICRRLPGTVETTTFGHPTFRAGKKTFVVFENYKGEDTICFKATLEDQTLLVLDPRFFVAPYIGQHGWTSMRVASGVDWDEVEELVRESYRLVATKTMKERFEATGAARRSRKK